LTAPKPGHRRRAGSSTTLSLGCSCTRTCSRSAETNSRRRRRQTEDRTGSNEFISGSILVYQSFTLIHLHEAQWTASSWGRACPHDCCGAPVAAAGRSARRPRAASAQRRSKGTTCQDQRLGLKHAVRPRCVYPPPTQITPKFPSFFEHTPDGPRARSLCCHRTPPACAAAPPPSCPPWVGSLRRTQWTLPPPRRLRYLNVTQRALSVTQRALSVT
jgi:hypothetical protein